jgi:hypothetical protein
MAESTITPRSNDSIDWWMAENPEVAATIPTANLGAFKQRLNCANNIGDIPLNTRKASSKAVKAVKSAGQFTKHQMSLKPCCKLLGTFVEAAHGM